MENHEELTAKAEEIAKEITDIFASYSPQPRIVFLAALSASLKLLADSIEGGGGPSAEETMNRFIEYTAVCFATCNKNNA
jgi:hypothetical protein